MFWKVLSAPIAGALLALAAGAQAHEHEREHRDHGMDPIIGIWTVDVQRRDCASGTVLMAFKGIDAFQLGGTLIDVGIAPPWTRNPAIGYWYRDGQRHYTAKFVFARYFADGNLDGFTEGLRSLTLSKDGELLTGTTQVTIKNAQGDVVAHACATDTSVRFK
jgi:hypothetical protein